MRVNAKELTESDRAELAKFKDYLRLSADAVRAGCTADEAARAMFPHVYADDNGDDNA